MGHFCGGCGLQWGKPAPPGGAQRDAKAAIKDAPWRNNRPKPLEAPEAAKRLFRLHSAEGGDGDVVEMLKVAYPGIGDQAFPKKQSLAKTLQEATAKLEQATWKQKQTSLMVANLEEKLAAMQERFEKETDDVAIAKGELQSAMQAVKAETNLQVEEWADPQKDEEDEDDFKDAIEFTHGTALEGSDLAIAALQAKAALEAKRAADQACQEARAKWEEARDKEERERAEEDKEEAQGEQEKQDPPLDEQGDGVMGEAGAQQKRGPDVEQPRLAEPSAKKGKKDGTAIHIDLEEGDDGKLQREVDELNSTGASAGSSKAPKSKAQQQKDDKRKRERAAELIRAADAKAAAAAKKLPGRSRSPVPRGERV